MKPYSFFIFLFFCFCGLGVKAQTSTINAIYKAKQDTAFSQSSQITNINVNARVISNLTLLGQVWGFVKYHLPSVAKGDINMDAELFRVMPKVIKAQSKNELCEILEKWIDNLGMPEPCNNCKSINMKDVVRKPDYGSLFNSRVVTRPLINKLSYILDNRRAGENYYIKTDEKAGNPVFQNELPYYKPLYPDAGIRVLALFRYWNIIQYFSPYKHLIGTDWNLALPKYLPQFIQAKNDTEYDLAVMKIISSTHDTHANVWDAPPGLTNYQGDFTIPFQPRYIENKLVVTGLFIDTVNFKSRVKIGDEIKTVNGKNVNVLIKRFLPITVGSNREGELSTMLYNYLLRSKDSVFNLGIYRDGAAINVKQPGIKYYKWNAELLPQPKDPGYYVIDGNIGYLYAGKYHEKDISDIGKTLMNTKGIIIDMRCYPSDNNMVYNFVPYIKSGNAPFVKVIQPDVTVPGVFRIADTLTIAPEPIYKDKVVVIVNELTLSLAEFTTMAFQSSPNVTVIGSKTAGADGNISTIVLPGWMVTRISGLEYLYPDGTQTQRVGVKIDEVVKPTIEGIKAGRDEQLERAKQIILSK